MRRRVVVASVVWAALAVAPLAGCGDDDDDDDEGATPTTASAPATTSSTAAPPTTASPSTTAPSTTAPPTTAGGATEEPSELGDSDDTGRSELEDGRHFGFWETFEIGDTIAYGEFDLAQLLTGAAAEAAAAERGDEVNNDYYIVNDNPRLRTLIAEGDTVVQVLEGGTPDLIDTNVADFAVERSPDAGFWVTIEDGIVTEIEQQFVP
jgi:hypothetical protein